MANGMSFNFNSQEMSRGIFELDAKVHGAVSAIVDFNAMQAEADLKMRAPWTDRTAAARTGLHTMSFNEQKAWTILLAHSVAYGVWLETRNDFQGRYAVILPVLVDSANRLMAMLEGLFGKV